MDENELKDYEGFTVKLALLDALPVLFFSLSLILVASLLSGTGLTFVIIITGAVLIAAAGLCKVLWKLFLGLKVGNIKILNRIFVPFMAGGFLITVAGTVIGTVLKKIRWKSVFAAVLTFPALLFFALGFVGFFIMGRVKSKNSREEFNKDAGKNLFAQLVNTFAQSMIFFGILSAKKK